MKKRPDEFELIARHFAPLAGDGSFGLNDDAALYKPAPGKEIVITQDAIAERVHFLADDPPELIAKKALRVNLSDLAAKGAQATVFSLSLGLSDDWNDPWVASFASGLGDDCEAYNVRLTGGDTFRSGGGTVISITALGEIDQDSYVSRLSASAGDLVYVTGSIGDAAIGLDVRLGKHAKLSGKYQEYFEKRYLLPEPRCNFAPMISRFASASMDVSDGLIADLKKLCKASDVSASINLSDVPFSESLQRMIDLDPECAERAVTGGDDYELLFCVPRSIAAEFDTKIGGIELPVSRIGIIEPSGLGVNLVDANGQPVKIETSGYTHFGDEN